MVRGKLFFVDGITATLTDDGWSCKDPLTKDYLNAFYWATEPETQGPDVPDYLGELLRKASSDLAADITDDNPPQQVSKRVY